MTIQRTQQDYINVLQQLSPQPYMAGDYTTNQSIIAGALVQADNQIQSFQESLNPIANNGFLPHYLSDWNPLITPGDSVSNQISALTEQMTAFANRGSQCMLPWGATKFDASSNYFNALYGAVSDFSGIWPIWKIQKGGWDIYMFENQPGQPLETPNSTPFFYVGNAPWPETSVPKQLYATALDSGGFNNYLNEYSSQWVLDVQMFPTPGLDASASSDLVENYIKTILPAWVKPVIKIAPLFVGELSETPTQTLGGSSLDPNHKTIFSNQSIITPSWLNTIYYNPTIIDGITVYGHLHDDGTTDGHSNFINLGTDMAGILNSATQLNFTESMGTVSVIPNPNDFSSTSPYLIATYLNIGNMVQLEMPDYFYIGSISNTFRFSLSGMPSNLLPQPNVCGPIIVENTAEGTDAPAMYIYDGTQFNLGIYDGIAYNLNGFTDSSKGLSQQLLIWGI